jgi:flagellin
MSISYSANLAALRLGGKLRETASQLGSAFERLSSGVRINKASDNPGGLALADRLRNDSRMMTVAIRNANDALSLTTVTDSALGEISNILQRMSELTIQGSSSAYTTTQRSAMQLEFAALGSEIDRVAGATVFNSINLLSNSSNLITQIGITTDGYSRLTIPSAIATLAALGLGNGTQLTYSLTGTTTSFAASASRTAYSAIQTAIDEILLQRGSVGTTASRLSSAITSLTSLREGTLEAEADIRDADVAADATQLVRLQVLQQSQTALMAQANQMPSLVLRLLG